LKFWENIFPPKRNNKTNKILFIKQIYGILNKKSKNYEGEKSSGVDLGSTLTYWCDLTCSKHLINQMGFPDLSGGKTMAHNPYVQEKGLSHAHHELLLFYSGHHRNYKMVLEYIYHYG